MPEQESNAERSTTLSETHGGAVRPHGAAAEDAAGAADPARGDTGVSGAGCTRRMHDA
jgi:hypothetical protein